MAGSSQIYQNMALFSPCGQYGFSSMSNSLCQYLMLKLTRCIIYTTYIYQSKSYWHLWLMPWICIDGTLLMKIEGYIVKHFQNAVWSRNSVTLWITFKFGKLYCEAQTWPDLTKAQIIQPTRPKISCFEIIFKLKMLIPMLHSILTPPPS